MLVLRKTFDKRRGDLAQQTMVLGTLWAAMKPFSCPGFASAALNLLWCDTVHKERECQVRTSKQYTQPFRLWVNDFIILKIKRIIHFKSWPWPGEGGLCMWSDWSILLFMSVFLHPRRGKAWVWGCKNTFCIDMGANDSQLPNISLSLVATCLWALVWKSLHNILHWHGFILWEYVEIHVIGDVATTQTFIFTLLSLQLLWLTGGTLSEAKEICSDLFHLSTWYDIYSCFRCLFWTKLQSWFVTVSGLSIFRKDKDSNANRYLYWISSL